MFSGWVGDQVCTRIFLFSSADVQQYPKQSLLLGVIAPCIFRTRRLKVCSKRTRTSYIPRGTITQTSAVTSVSSLSRTNTAYCVDYYVYPVSVLVGGYRSGGGPSPQPPLGRTKELFTRWYQAMAFMP